MEGESVFERHRELFDGIDAIMKEVEPDPEQALREREREMWMDACLSRQVFRSPHGILSLVTWGDYEADPERVMRMAEEGVVTVVGEHPGQRMELSCPRGDEEE